MVATLLANLFCVATALANPPTVLRTERAAFAQHCFWTGEMKFGQIEGVVRTEAGFIEGHEVTLVDYSPETISFDQLVKQGVRANCADTVYVTTPKQEKLAARTGYSRIAPLKANYRRASVSDQKKQLQGTPAAELDLTPEQATKVNAWIRTDSARALSFLTPEQRAALR